MQKLEIFDGLSQVFPSRRSTTDLVPQKRIGLPLVPLEILFDNCSCRAAIW
jgi:hypothetical protein